MPLLSSKSPNDTKLKELILFIASRSEDDVRFGSTKLNKLLFFADFLAYVKLGKAITNHAYMRLPNGPAPRALLPITKKMIAAKTLAIQERDHYGKTQKVPIALREADLKLFSPEEIAVVTDVLSAFRKNNARGISALSHKFDGWKLAKDGETIPYEVALVQFKKPKQRDIEKALAMGAELATLRKEAGRSNAAKH
jgi:hypothetical protein